MRRLAFVVLVGVLAWAVSCGGEDSPSAPSGRYASTTSALATGTGLRGDYFDTLDFSQLKTTRTDPTINFDWAGNMPPGVALTDQFTFSVRWTGQVEAPATGTYTFTVGSDDGCRLWVNGQLLIADWTLHSYKENSATISLTAGKRYDIKLEYYENLGVASVKLFWTYTGQAKQIVPTVRLYPPAPLPVLTAPPLNPTVPTEMGDATAFLYSGANPVQSGVDAGVIDKQRVAVARGRVVGRNGQPVSGINVEAVGHSELGKTQSRADGWYDFAFNGGGTLLLQFSGDGYLTLQRHVRARWNRYSVLEDVTLTALDSSVTAITPNAAALQVARSSVSSDDAGTRQVTLMFPANTTATAALPDGGSVNLSSLHVRATEFTVGPTGPSAMPGELPGTSAYTHAVEYSVDEAVAQNATEVRFNKDVPGYVDNFLNFPVGVVVPVGYYDRQSGLWKPEADGRVVKILSRASGQATLDVDGDGQADTGAKLTSLGITTAELQQLAITYPTGTPSLWRMLYRHFTAYDHNWPFFPPDDAGFGDVDMDIDRADSCRTKKKGSIIECENQTLIEGIPVSGTGLSLVYRSDRVPGRVSRYTLTVPIVDVSPDCIQIEIFIMGLGRTQHFQIGRGPSGFPPSASWIWDGKDAYGRDVNGRQAFHVGVSYKFAALYQAAPPSPSNPGPTFGSRYANSSILVIPPSDGSRGIYSFDQEWDVDLGEWKDPPVDLGGWRLSSNHVLQPGTGILHRGDGDLQNVEARLGVVRTAAGALSSTPPADGLRATDVGLSMNGLAASADGSLLFTMPNPPALWRVKPDGTLQRLGGNGSSLAGGTLPYGDGVLATSVGFGSGVSGAAVGPDGSVYFVFPNNFYVMRISPDGKLYRVAGNGSQGHSGDGFAATNAQLYSPTQVALDAAGNVYIADLFYVRRVDPSGIITTVAGDGGVYNTTPGQPATQTSIVASSIAVSKNGDVYIYNSNTYRVWRVDARGTASWFGGNGLSGAAPDGVPFLSASLAGIGRLAMGDDGLLLIPELGSYRVRKVLQDQTLTTIAGDTTSGWPIDGMPALGTPASTPLDVAPLPNGGFAFSNGSFIWVVDPVVKNLSAGARLVSSPDAAEVYLFDSSGRHLKTLDTLTNAVMSEFTYDSSGRLSMVKDVNGNIVTVERDASGRPSALVAPFGQRTVLGVDANGWLSSVRNPAGETILLEMQSNGLLTKLTDAKSQAHVFTYGSDGRLNTDADPAGSIQTVANSRGYSRTTGITSTSTVTTRLGRQSTFIVQTPLLGSTTRTSIREDGATTQTVTDPSGLSSTTTGADRVVITAYKLGDPRFGSSAPLSMTQTTLPSGLAATAQFLRSVTLSNPSDLLSLTAQTETRYLNSRAWTVTYDAASRTRTFRSPTGRTSTAVLDAKGRVTKTTLPGLADVIYTYDTTGRLQSVQQGTRTVSWTFGTDGLPATSIDALTRVTTYTRDAVGRVKITQLPASREVDFGYDLNGNLNSVTPPGQPAHGFTFSGRDDVATYVPPTVTSPPASPIGTRSTTYGYDFDGSLTSVTLPDSTAIMPTYDTFGRLNTIQTPRTTIQMHYSPDAGQLTSITDALASGATPTASNVTYTYDGPLLTATMWSGAINGSIGYTYNADFNVATSVVLGTPLVTSGYDDDLLLASVTVDAGTPNTLTLTRDLQNGLLSGSSVGTLTTSQTYDSYGALATLSAMAGSTALYSATITPDGAGRIHQKVESVQGVSHTYVYTYDSADRLTDLTMDGAAAGHWTYNGNGDRLTGTAVGAPGTTLTGTYDSQDRIISYGSNTYVFGPNGDLRSKTAAAQTTTYVYDGLGALSRVTLPNGDRIDYVLDAAGRRVGKKLNGTLQRGWLYEGIHPVAEVNSTGVVVARFIYGIRSHVPDMMWKAGVLYRYVTDERGSVRLVVNASTGAVAQRIDYDVWGNITADTSPGFQPFGYAGGLWDTSTKLLRFGARDYDPDAGRWTNKDPIRFAAGDSNLFAYAFNDPVNHIDSTGFIIDVAPNVSDKTKLAIRRFRSDPCGAELWDQLERSPLTFIIRDAELERGNKFTGQVPVPGKTTGYAAIEGDLRTGGAIIKMDWIANDRAGGYPWYQPRTPTEALAHEFFHASGLLTSDHLNSDENGANNFGRRFKYLDGSP